MLTSDVRAAVHLLAFEEFRLQRGMRQAASTELREECRLRALLEHLKLVSGALRLQTLQTWQRVAAVALLEDVLEAVLRAVGQLHLVHVLNDLVLLRIPRRVRVLLLVGVLLLVLLLVLRLILVGVSVLAWFVRVAGLVSIRLVLLGSGHINLDFLLEEVTLLLLGSCVGIV